MLSVGQVYQGPYVFANGSSVEYQILALWEDFAWVHVFYRGVSSGRQPDKGPKTYGLSFFDVKGITLLYELPEHANR